MISCLGLFGLAAFDTERRTKEIGIRKVLGADMKSLIALLSKDFLKLVCIAIIVASPVAYYLMNRWLQDFAYRVNISWWIFIAAGTMALLIALLTVSFQAIKAAIANPVKSLERSSVSTLTTEHQMKSLLDENLKMMSSIYFAAFQFKKS